MGDRANVYVHDGDAPGVYLYTRWDGMNLPQVVHRALVSRNGRNRWNDAPYLTRIIFEEMIRGRERQETGYGISAQFTNGQLVKVNVAKQTVTVGDREPVSFTDYIYNLHPTW